MLPLNYETPEKPKKRSWSFWLALASAYLPGILVLDILDDIFHTRMTGHHNDGGIVCVSCFAFPFFAGVAAIMRAISARFESVFFAVAFAIFAPVLAYLLWVLATLWI